MTTGLKPPSSYYLEPIVNFPPRPIANEAEYQATQAQINKILERSNLTEDDRARYARVITLFLCFLSKYLYLVPEWDAP